MKILVTGAQGMLGHKLVALLDRAPEIDLIATARSEMREPLVRGTFCRLDIQEANQVNTVLEQTHPDVVINTAALAQVDLCEQEKDLCWNVNVKAVANLVQGCKTNGIFLVHVSTDFVFEGTQALLNEEAVPGPVNYYGKSKLAGEEVVKNGMTEWAIVRTVLVYGTSPDPGRTNIVLWVKKSLEDGKMIRVVNNQWRTPTLVEDLAMGCYLVAGKRAKGVFHVSGEELMTPYDAALATASHFGLDASLIKPIEAAELKQSACRPLKTGFVVDKAKQELGFRPHTFREGLSLMSAQLSLLPCQSS